MNLIEEILNLVFPPVCGICNNINKNFLCDNCKEKIKKITYARIERYKNEDIYFEEAMYVFKYEDFIRNKLISYKFNDKSYLYKTFEKIILNNKKVCDFIKCYDIIIPVPIHNKRKNERGFNQSELIAKELVQELNLKNHINIIVDKTSLIKTKNIKKQSLLNKKERINNVIGCYLLTNNLSVSNLYNKKILIFDDIYTTGSTVNECAKMLKLSNPSKIGVLTLAKD